MTYLGDKLIEKQMECAMKPCPFCGKDVKLKKIGLKLYQFKCCGCKFKFRYNGLKKQAQSAWNKREGVRYA